SFGAGVPTTNFGVVWSGMIEIATPGPTTFTSLADDAVKLYVDNVLILNNDGGHGVTAPASGTANLTAGLHDLRVYFTQGAGGDESLLTWTPPGGAAQPIPFTTAQPIPFGVLYTPDPLNLGNVVNVSKDSTIQASGSNWTALG